MNREHRIAHGKDAGRGIAADGFGATGQEKYKSGDRQQVAHFLSSGHGWMSLRDNMTRLGCHKDKTPAGLHSFPCADGDCTSGLFA
jgi:hypothetical protein